MNKKASELKKGDKVKIAAQEGIVENIELSEIGKHGKRKCRLEIRLSNGKKTVIIRPEDYPLTVL